MSRYVVADLRSTTHSDNDKAMTIDLLKLVCLSVVVILVVAVIAVCVHPADAHPIVFWTTFAVVGLVAT